MSVVILLVLSGAGSAQSFKGFYVGGSVGGANGNSDAKTSTVFSPTGYFAASSVPAIAPVVAQNPSGNGFAGGGQAGYTFPSAIFPLLIGPDFAVFTLST